MTDDSDFYLITLKFQLQIRPVNLWLIKVAISKAYGALLGPYGRCRSERVKHNLDGLCKKT